MAEGPDDAIWEEATWEGSRRAMLRRVRRLTVRERLEALEELARTGERLAEVGRRARSSPGAASQDPADDT